MIANNSNSKFFLTRRKNKIKNEKLDIKSILGRNTAGITSKLDTMYIIISKTICL